MNEIEGEWHFVSNCPLWPSVDYFEIDVRPVRKDNRICKECIRLDSATPH
jgi:hypothetical protein